MSHVEGFPDRDGLDKLVKLGKAMCNTVALFAPILIGKYPDNTTITALLAAIQGVCALLPDVENTFLVETGDNTIPNDNPELVAGINPDAPAAIPPDIT